MRFLAKTIPLLLTIILAGCGSPYQYWDLSHFNLDPESLNSGDKVKVLYTSRAPSDYNGMEYYIHMVVTAVATGDTVNLLTTANNDLKASDPDKVFTFSDERSLVSKIIRQDLSDIEGIDVDKLESAEMKRYDKVIRDPRYDQIADNNHPTVIGVIGVSNN